MLKPQLCQVANLHLLDSEGTKSKLINEQLKTKNILEVFFVIKFTYINNLNYIDRNINVYILPIFKYDKKVVKKYIPSSKEKYMCVNTKNIFLKG